MPIQLCYLPNLITLTRLLLTVPITVSLLTLHQRIALSLLMIAALTDWLDGWLARRYVGWDSQLGAFLDPMADKVLLVSVFLTVGYLRWIPLWVVVVAVGRDIGILLGIFIYRLWIGPLDYQPILISKLNTLLQIVLVISSLVQQELWYFPDRILTTLRISMVGTSLLSFISYAWVWISKVRAHVKRSY